MYGEIIRRLRKEKKLTQGQLAEMLNFKSASAVGMIEREEREVNLDTMKKLTEIFNVSSDYILGKTSERNSGEINELETYYNNLIDILGKTNDADKLYDPKCGSNGLLKKVLDEQKQTIIDLIKKEFDKIHKNDEK